MPVDDESAALRRFEVLTKRGSPAMYVTGDDLIVDHKAGDVFSLSDARLGIWTLNGSPLHLQGDRKRLVLGGLDHRIAAGTRLDVPPVDPYRRHNARLKRFARLGRATRRSAA